MLEADEQLQQGRYRIKHQLGRGGMGTVYLATDRNLSERQVAIKENADSTPEVQQQFRHEASVLARLTHQNLPRVTDFFIEPSGFQYLVMDYVIGEDLRQIAQRQNGPLPEADVLDWIGKVMDALEYMHGWVNPETGLSSPIVHRDIKPGNIKVAHNQRVVLVDFGLAKYLSSEVTEVGARGATPGYSPPEQYSGGTDPRSDIYSLGATLYLLLTGQRPPDAIQLATGETLTPPHDLNPAIQPNTERVILRAMQKRAADRFQAVQQMRAALFAGTADDSEPTVMPGGAGAKGDRSSPPASSPVRSSASRRWLWLGLLLLLIAAVSSLLLDLPSRLAGGRQSTEVVTLPTQPPVAIAPAAEATKPDPATPTQSVTQIATQSVPQIATLPATATTSALVVVTSTVTTVPPTASETATASDTATPQPTVTPEATATPEDTGTSSSESVNSAALSTTADSAATAIPLPTDTATTPPTTTNTATPLPTDTATTPPTATNSATPRPTATATPLPTNTATTPPTATNSATPRPTATATPLPTNTATATTPPTATNSATPRPTATATASPTNTAIALPTATATPFPSATPTPVRSPTATHTAITLLPTNTETPPLSAGQSVRHASDDALYLYIPEGEFMMGSNERNDDDAPPHPVYLNGYWIKQTEVTNVEFARCVAAGKCKDLPRIHNAELATHPVVGITWEQAAVYAAFVGGRLPTEAEWEKAALGESAARYPWGDALPNSSLANYNTSSTRPVGSFPAGASPYGVLDMAGNVKEWVADWYDKEYYSVSPSQNPTGPSEGKERSIRGGSYTSNAASLRSARRDSGFPHNAFEFVGFRVVLDKPTAR